MSIFVLRYCWAFAMWRPKPVGVSVQVLWSPSFGDNFYHLFILFVLQTSQHISHLVAIVIVLLLHPFKRNDSADVTNHEITIRGYKQADTHRTSCITPLRSKYWKSLLFFEVQALTALWLLLLRKWGAFHPRVVYGGGGRGRKEVIPS